MTCDNLCCLALVASQYLNELFCFNVFKYLLRNLKLSTGNYQIQQNFIIIAINILTQTSSEGCV